MKKIVSRRVWVEGGELEEGRWEVRTVTEHRPLDGLEELYRDKTRYLELMHEPDQETDENAQPKTR